MISHKHKVIFVHVPKTAGQSVEQAFLDDLGLDWNQRRGLLLRPNSDPAKGPVRLAHLYADEYVRLGHIGQAEFDSYYKFAVVRNPYERLLSEYRYRTFRQTGPFWWFLRRPWHSEFSDQVRHMVPQTRYLLNADGKCLVDRIVRFENIEAEMAEVFRDIFGEPRPLPRRNTSHRQERRMGREDLSVGDRARIRKMYQRDFAYLGYDAEG